MNLFANADESRLLEEAHEAVLEQTKKNVFEAAPYERATELLERLAPAECVDDRVRLALDITRATRMDYRPDLSRRALYAAFPSSGDIRDDWLKRKWFTFAGIVEAGSGNVDRSLKYKFVALELCERLKDSLGLVAEWNGLANLANGAGLYEDAVKYATIAVEVKLDSGANSLQTRGMTLLNRANAMLRLGRYAEGESDIFASLTSIAYPLDAATRNQLFLAQQMFAEFRLESGDLSAARTALDAAATWASACDAPRFWLQLKRVRARLLALEFGYEQAVPELRGLLEQAYALEAKFGQSSLDDTVLDILNTLERVHREHGDVHGADCWLTAIGARLRANAAKMLDALANKPVLADNSSVAAKMAEVDRYLQLIATPRLGGLKMAAPSWNYLIGLAATASGVEDSTKEHGVRVARLAGIVARELDLSAAMQRGIEAGCLVHDMGKISIPSSILLKRTPLDDGELHLYDAHPHVGSELLERVRIPEQTVVRNVIHFHHDCYEGEAIPLEARIASVCDRYDTLVTGRPRKAAVNSADALREIFQQRSRAFDPNVVDVFIEVIRRLERTHSDVQEYLSEEADNIQYFATQRILRKAASRALAVHEATS